MGWGPRGFFGSVSNAWVVQAVEKNTITLLPRAEYLVARSACNARVAAEPYYSGAGGPSAAEPDDAVAFAFAPTASLSAM